MKKNLTISTVCALALFSSAYGAEPVSVANNTYVEMASTLLLPADRSIDTGGNLSAIQAYSDGIGAVVTSDPSAPVDNTAMNNLVFKFGEAAQANSITVAEQVLYNSPSASASDIASATQILISCSVSDPRYTVSLVSGHCSSVLKTCNDGDPKTVDTLKADGTCSFVSNESLPCNDENAQTINDIYHNGICLGTNVEGQTCSDGNIQTIGDVYISGICTGMAVEGLACDDLNSNTRNDTYHNGVCSGILETCLTGFVGNKTVNLSCASKSLTNIDSWVALTSETASVYLDHNSLTNVSGLSGLKTVGSWIYLNNNSLTNVNGLSNLTGVGAGLNLTYNSLTNVDGLSGLKTIGGNLYLYNNNLTNLNGLSGLLSVGGSIEIYNNPNLQNLSGLNNVVMNAGSIIRFDSRAYTTKMAATAPICVALKDGTLSRSGATVAQVCN